MRIVRVLFCLWTASIVSASVLLAVLSGCQGAAVSDDSVVEVQLVAPEGRAIMAVASGCFWCVEEIFEAVVGVDSAVSGYAGGSVPNPTYALVNTETTGHAESVLVYYDPSVVSYEELVRVFYLSHDPTTPNQQGPDRGSSYRSILFHLSPREAQAAAAITEEFNQSRFEGRVVTELKALNTFYRAEEYHQDYVKKHPNHPYVQQVSVPRFARFKQQYDGALRTGE